MNDTTAHTTTETAASAPCSQGQDRKLSFAHLELMPCLFGGNSSTPAVKSESVAPSSAMNRSIKARNLFAKRMLSLTTAGLVKGIIPTSMRKQSGALILDIVFLRPAGKDVG